MKKIILLLTFVALVSGCQSGRKNSPDYNNYNSPPQSSGKNMGAPGGQGPWGGMGGSPSKGGGTF